jgi:regulatory protein YycH of two-component signal transduction system YycFG
MKADYYGAVLLGAVVVMSFLVLFYMIFDASLNVEPVEATPPKPIIEVVGTYKDCEIIQYTNENLARYSYMLYCENQK